MDNTLCIKFGSGYGSAMALLGREFIAVPDDRKGQIVFKWPDLTIRRFTRAIVNADEMAMFVNTGQVVQTLGPGRHQIDADELPGLGSIIDHVTGGNAYRAETRELVRVDLVPARAEGLHDLPRVDEQRHLVRVDDRAGEAADGEVRPFEDDLTFAVIRYGDEFPPEQCHALNHTGSLDWGMRRYQRSLPAIFPAWK